MKSVHRVLFYITIVFLAGFLSLGNGELDNPSLLTADKYTVSTLKGGMSTFTLDAGVENANRNYLILGTFSGTMPGIPLPGGAATLPINWDAFTTLVFNLINTVNFADFMGTLDANGKATAQLNLPPLPGELFGTEMHYAFALNGPWDMVSNAICIEVWL